MSANISHHIPSEILAAYAAGSLGQAFSLVVAAHVSLCTECRAELAAHEAAGGAVLDTIAAESVSPDLFARVLDHLDDPVQPEPAPRGREGVFPGPVMDALKGKAPRWKALGGGVKQCLIGGDDDGLSRLLFIPPKQAVPDHGHHGTELTLVLQGGFSDEVGHFDVGDVEVADAELEHTPVADAGPPCIVLAATDAPLKFNTFLPRLLQPLFGI
ncbi:ChrR family anti-sigma-E factor [Maritimibacter sp. HL-12]|uniref:ChrR family anti-sigma-E factor n=1 Tax=Maritimibacter sp. HL-12 TaxID=1162418 RepID=UPI000A0F04A7|nr:ChrR family anti-sigma-E factor [Maritimibacter sp. HL-12]SMH44312.1 anti-ECFsigma factor, ChrR [Maritimibacter sp. HL-12]